MSLPINYAVVNKEHYQLINHNNFHVFQELNNLIYLIYSYDTDWQILDKLNIPYLFVDNNSVVGSIISYYKILNGEIKEVFDLLSNYRLTKSLNNLLNILADSYYINIANKYRTLQHIIQGN